MNNLQLTTFETHFVQMFLVNLFELIRKFFVFLFFFVFFCQRNLMKLILCVFCSFRK